MRIDDRVGDVLGGGSGYAVASQLELFARRARPTRPATQREAKAAVEPPHLSLFSAEYAHLAAAPLAHFKHRPHVRYFDIGDGETHHVAEADQVLSNEFTFNGETHRLARPFDWLRNPSRDREWHILLHKFYYLRYLGLAYRRSREAAYAAKFVELVGSWIDTVPAGFIDPQVTGRRLQQWILAFYHFVDGDTAPFITDTFLLKWIASIDAQAAYLCDHLTPEGNHRTIELYAIFSVGLVFPELARAAHYLRFAREELLRNLRADLLRDGVHRELSTDYHHIVLKNFLRIRELAARNSVELPELFDDLLRQALEFSAYVHKPDGSIPAINDSDANDYRALLKKSLKLFPNESIRFVATRGEEGVPPRERSRHFAESGYCILRSDWRKQPFEAARYLFFDCGEVGFGTHGHYDLLSIEMAAFGKSLLVDPGRYTYDSGDDAGTNWRHRFKSTAYHNTVTVDGLDQCADHLRHPNVPKPRARVMRFVTTPTFDYVHGVAESPRYPVRHERKLLFLPNDYCLVVDRLTGPGAHRYDQRFHLSADSQGLVREESSDVCHRFVAPNLVVVQDRALAAATIETGFISPEYGRKLVAPVLRFSQGTAQGCDGLFVTILCPYEKRAPELTLQPVRVAPGQPDGKGYVARIDFTPADGVHHVDHVYVQGRRGAGCQVFGNIACDATVAWWRSDPDECVTAVAGVDIRHLSWAGRVLTKHSTPQTIPA